MPLLLALFPLLVGADTKTHDTDALKLLHFNNDLTNMLNRLSPCALTPCSLLSLLKQRDSLVL